MPGREVLDSGFYQVLGLYVADGWPWEVNTNQELVRGTHGVVVST